MQGAKAGHNLNKWISYSKVVVLDSGDSSWELTSAWCFNLWFGLNKCKHMICVLNTPLGKWSLLWPKQGASWRCLQVLTSKSIGAAYFNIEQIIWCCGIWGACRNPLYNSAQMWTTPYGVQLCDGQLPCLGIHCYWLESRHKVLEQPQ